MKSEHCKEHKGFKFREWIDCQHGNEIQVPSPLNTTATIELFRAGHIRTQIEGRVQYVSNQTNLFGLT